MAQLHILSDPPRTPEEVHAKLLKEGLEILLHQGATPAYWRNVGLRLALADLLHRRLRTRHGLPT